MNNPLSLDAAVVCPIINHRYLRSANKAILTVGIAFFVLAQSLLASGTIRGKVFDDVTTEGLPAANVAIQGTNIGAAADVDGNYRITNVPSGDQTLIISYIGYVSLSVDVTIPEEGTVIQDVGLRPDVVQGREVNVTAQARGQIQAINQQLASDKISSIVSEARIQELPDFNAAQALSRLPGISTLESSGEANKVVIRGLAPQYNTVSVEGVKLASTGNTQMGVVSLNWITSGKIDNDRSVDLSLVSPYMIKTIAVYKSLTPDMNANSLGGTVNMELREAPPEMHYDVLAQSGYTAKTGNYDNWRTVASFSQRFLDEQVGVYLLGNAEEYDRDADNMSAQYSIYSSVIDTTTGYRPIKVREVALNRHLETRKRYGGNLILDYRLPSGSIKSVNMYTRLTSDYTDHHTVLAYLTNVMDFRIRQGVKTTDLSVNSLAFKYDLSRVGVDLKYAQTTSKNNLPQSPYSRLRQTGGLGGTIPVDTPPDSLKKNVDWYGPEETLLSNISLFSSLYTEERQSLSADFKFPIGIGVNLVGYIKIGGQYHDQRNTNDQESPYAAIGTGSDIQDDIAEAIVQLFHVQYDSAYGRFPASQFMGEPILWTDPFLDDRFGTFYWAGDPEILKNIAKFLHNTPEFVGRTGGPENTGGWFNGLFQQLANDYEYSEQYTAGYVMSELSLPRLQLVGGARYEKVEMEYTAYNMVDTRSPEI
ncbi:MAG: carboxypeptidase-like regulatory domain-containing protein [Fidelibacterota bacterium]|nr:MAG: carboxypeptidase-like regulatory domain-containing protein [Candidatus Neomarinimicrobiota bacterium]